jgi:hypothetical protein
MDMNIYELIKGKKKYLPESVVKGYMYQLVKAVDHMHRCVVAARRRAAARTHAHTHTCAEMVFSTGISNPRMC